MTTLTTNRLVTWIPTKVDGELMSRYSYTQTSQVVAVIEKRKHLHRMEKDPLSFEICISRNGQSD